MLIRVAVADKAELADLHHALACDPELRPHATVTATVDEDATTLGAIDVIDIALTHAVAIATLVYSVAGNKKGRSATTFTAANGKTLTIKGGETYDPQIVIAFLEANTGDEP
ncbi:hypothetical protein AB0J83_45620 [Actinoplanes sp. NPDC049596]|uniref:effector-associated constant component EACC1 n=1 Tax=unclassified Actinoplanes TaxID=2626549 RepID=UPI00341BF5C4